MTREFLALIRESKVLTQVSEGQNPNESFETGVESRETSGEGLERLEGFAMTHVNHFVTCFAINSTIGVESSNPCG